MEDLTSLVKGLVSQFGRSFFLANFLPVLIGVAINQYIIFAPDLSKTEALWNIFTAVSSPWLGVLSGEMLTTITIALLLSLPLSMLNIFVTKFFEGMAPGMKVMLFPFYARRRAQHKRMYQAIQERRMTRQKMLSDFELRDEEPSDSELDTYYAVQEKLDQLHNEREKQEPVQVLPYDPKRVMPTSFGNAWAVMEEYPLARYGIDSAVFWPYVRVVMSDRNPDLLEQIDNQKLLIDIAINLALVALILVAEGLIFGVVNLHWQLLLLALVCVALFWAFYRAGVNYALALGSLVSQSFDLYRLDVLDAFDLERPTDLEDEYWVWMRLAAFLRRGEPFYFDQLVRRGEEVE